MTALAPPLQAYFTDRLIGQRAASPNTMNHHRIWPGCRIHQRRDLLGGQEHVSFPVPFGDAADAGKSGLVAR